MDNIYIYIYIYIFNSQVSLYHFYFTQHPTSVIPRGLLESDFVLLSSVS